VTLLEHATEILASMERARAAVDAVKGGGGVPLQLASSEPACVYRLPGFLQLLNRALPGLKVEVEIASVGLLGRQVLSGRSSVMLASGTEGGRGWESAPEGLPRRVLWAEDVVLVGVPSAARAPKRVLVAERECVFRDITEADLLGGSKRVEVMQVGSLEGVKSAVLAGLGVGVLPAVAVQPWLASGRLISLPLCTSRKVVTYVAWNEQSCPATVAACLRRLQPSAVAGATG
jgi:DNA-binding transcriptional LysR family regulator